MGLKTAAAIAACLGSLAAGGTAAAQSLTVLPVVVQMPAGELATSLTVINAGDTETAVQVRVLAWNQPGGTDQLTASDDVMTSPPVTTIAPGTSQVVRLVLRDPPKGQEATYRILLDQIPPAAAPGTVRVALRLSIPVFAEPTGRAVSHLTYRIERDAGEAYLVASNDGGRHETIRDIALTTKQGTVLKTDGEASPYILAGATRRWAIAGPGGLPADGGSLRMTAMADTGAIDQAVKVAARP
jgi:fimbrial chaperone protein